MASLLSLKNVGLTFHDAPEPFAVLERIGLQIVPGEFLVLVGPSGCGKSTLLRIMSGLQQQSTGRITLGKGVQQNDMSFVFQQFALLPWLTVAENVAIGLVARGVSEDARRVRVRRVLEQFGLLAFADTRPRTLSGGQRQRVGLARALVTDPKIIFMDEPFSELDSFTAEELRAALLTTWTEQHVTIVMVTHIIAEAVELADRIVVLSERPSHVVEVIENTLPRPRQQRSQEFFAIEDRVRELIRAGRTQA